MNVERRGFFHRNIFLVNGSGEIKGCGRSRAVSPLPQEPPRSPLTKTLLSGFGAERRTKYQDFLRPAHSLQ
jgi:hypothetical protein